VAAGAAGQGRAVRCADGGKAREAADARVEEGDEVDGYARVYRWLQACGGLAARNRVKVAG
jgi:hypothetical protein